MSVFGVCLAWVALAAAPADSRTHASAFIPVEAFTLAWTHSIEKVRWEEDYAVARPEAPGAPPLLQALAARVKGSAAGMEPPPDAVLKNGWYGYSPTQRFPVELRLSRSEFVPDYELCIKGTCRPLSHWLPSDGGVTQLTACPAP
ncbi:MAG TPA: DUF1850 domain-containing protein [Hydrogenophaga sp.]|nr:DUF1850 domain-containing protein [Hydrogenophaga sp.]